MSAMARLLARIEAREEEFEQEAEEALCEALNALEAWDDAPGRKAAWLALDACDQDYALALDVISRCAHKLRQDGDPVADRLWEIGQRLATAVDAIEDLGL